MLAQLEVHMEIVVVAFAFILEDFAELFVEYFCVEKYITGYDYEKETAQSFTAAVSSITLNLIGKVSYKGRPSPRIPGRSDFSSDFHRTENISVLFEIPKQPYFVLLHLS